MAVYCLFLSLFFLLGEHFFKEFVAISTCLFSLVVFLLVLSTTIFFFFSFSEVASLLGTFFYCHLCIFNLRNHFSNLLFLLFFDFTVCFFQSFFLCMWSFSFSSLLFVAFIVEVIIFNAASLRKSEGDLFPAGATDVLPSTRRSYQISLAWLWSTRARVTDSDQTVQRGIRTSAVLTFGLRVSCFNHSATHSHIIPNRFLIF